MVRVIYIEREVEQHPRVEEICARLTNAVRVPCDRYGEVFQRHAQNFRLQKRRPSLILARKHGRLVHDAPEGCRLREERRYFYFSHMLNCVYDCRYCFLQGMFRSAHWVVFVNYEDFAAEITATATASAGESYFFSGFDCDSLAFEPVTGFARTLLPLFETLPGAWLELRTKSVQVKQLLERDPIERCVIAFSMTPAAVAAAMEHNVPPLERRLAAIDRLVRAGWSIGLRFDPLVWHPGWEDGYRSLFDAALARVPEERLHSVSVGAFRMPRDYYKASARLYPDEPLFAGRYDDHDGVVSYPRALEDELVTFAERELARRVAPGKLHPYRAGASTT
jgi:spore photoproduct lyase